MTKSTEKVFIWLFFIVVFMKQNLGEKKIYSPSENFPKYTHPFHNNFLGFSPDPTHPPGIRKKLPLHFTIKNTLRTPQTQKGVDFRDIEPELKITVCYKRKCICNNR